MTWYVVGRVYDTDNEIGLPDIYVEESATGQITKTDHDGRYWFTFADSVGSTIVSIFVSGYLIEANFRNAFFGGTGSDITVDFNLSNDTHRQRHPRDHTFHVATDYDYGVASTLLSGSGGYSANLRDVLRALVQAVRDQLAPYFTAFAQIVLPIIDLANWAWSTRIHDTSGTYAELRTAAYGNGVWVAGGWFNTMFTATIGETISPATTWTPRNPGFSTDNIEGVMYDGSVWIAVGGNGKIRTATDPTSTWTARTSNTTRYLLGVTKGGSEYAAYGGSGGVCALTTTTSPTGTWTSRSTTVFDNVTSNDLAQIIYVNGLWIAIGDNAGHIFTATTAAGTWTDRGKPDASVVSGNGIAYGNGWYVAATFDNTSNAGPWITRDVINGPWTKCTTNYKFITNVAFTDETFVITAFNTGVGQTEHVLTAQFPTDTWVLRDTITNLTGSNNLRLGNDGVRTWVVLGDDGDSSHPVLDLAWSTSPTKVHADAVMFKLGTGSFTMDTWLAGRLLFNSVLLRTQSGSKTADAAIKRNQVGTFTSDAFVGT